MSATEPTAAFSPLDVCRACGRPGPACLCDPVRDCPRCRGNGFNCIDDICHGKGYCIHGDTCWHCDGTGRVLPERVLVIPDQTAAAIREYAREHPSIVKARYRSDTPDQDPITSACYPMAEAYYHHNDREHEVYCLSWQDVDDALSGTHWYLREPEARFGERRWIDLGLALPQLGASADLPPYEQGTHRGWLTGDTPSKRCQKILAAIEDGSSSGEGQP